jgi:hypothetical protein
MSRSHQQVIGRDHCVAADGQLAGQLAGRRQRITRGQAPLQYRHAQLTMQRLGQAPCAHALERQVEG